ncbi:MULTISPECIES: hypothetical protein [unclassified Microbacterium]|nr:MULTISPECIES: hypothetical protein [unclassified Microbacterium]MCR2811005.1 hypothetical protein [Microbacterium sp. zg.B185]WIM19597.1 hypothetical protein QNO12_01975 [Microbacterium sp. zg-B185]
MLTELLTPHRHLAEQLQPGPRRLGGRRDADTRGLVFGDALTTAQPA